ncbi:MAG TPA: FAD-dependent oxidoreductase, partial [Rhodocyclaceae bacterium]|nr:FAD-dependent oxidoreductase [Rhodocyclaceae bacterium]
MTAPIVILGTGLAGTSVVRELRKLNPDIPITLVSADHGGFYSKPMLSNALAQNKTPAQLLVTPAEKLAEQLKVTLRAHTRVTSIDVANNKLVTAQGDIDYSALVLAVGAHPIRLPIQGDGAADVLSVNSLDDYTAFRERL